MTSQSTLLFLKGLHLNNRILELTKNVHTKSPGKQKIKLSFDLFCVLIEYFVIINNDEENIDLTIEELLSQDSLQVEVGAVTYTLEVNFFSPSNTLIVG